MPWSDHHPGLKHVPHPTPYPPPPAHKNIHAFQDPHSCLPPPAHRNIHPPLDPPPQPHHGQVFLQAAVAEAALPLRRSNGGLCGTGGRRGGWHRRWAGQATGQASSMNAPPCSCSWRRSRAGGRCCSPERSPCGCGWRRSRKGPLQASGGPAALLGPTCKLHDASHRVLGQQILRLKPAVHSGSTKGST